MRIDRDMIRMRWFMISTFFSLSFLLTEWGQAKLILRKTLTQKFEGKKEERLSGNGNKTKRKSHELQKTKGPAERSTPTPSAPHVAITYIIKQQEKGRKRWDEIAIKIKICLSLLNGKFCSCFQASQVPLLRKISKCKPPKGRK